MNAPSPVRLAGAESAPSSGVRLGRIVLALFLAAYFVCGALFLLVRDVLVPRVETYRPEIVAAISRAVGLPVSIDALSADWSGLRPRLHLSGLQILDREGRPALHLAMVDATLAWSSLVRGQVHFHRLEVQAPTLALRREADGQIFVAGARMDPGASGGGFSDWLLAQREIVIRNAAVSWTDAQRAAPELRLTAVDFRLFRSGGRYRFGLRALPPLGLATALDVRGDMVGTDASDPGVWAGQLFVAVDGADLGGWRPWVDYPLPIVGRGGVRAWLGVGGGTARSLTASLALDDVATRLGDGLPELELVHLRGQISARRGPDGMELATRGLELATGEGVSLAPTDIDFALNGADADGVRGGRLRANRLDFAALARLAAHLPFEAGVRQRLAALAPRGRLDDLRLSWSGPVEAPEGWRLQARFADLGVNPQGVVPGLSGVSGEIDGDRESGRFRLTGNDAALELPEIFPEPRLGFATLRAEGGWGRRDGRPEIVLDNASFENADAAGTASGRYVPIPGEAGEIDLSARLTRADGQAVWRYLPKVVNEHTRQWLRESLTGGVVPDARLRLKGNLADFPFADGRSGQFLVTTRVSGASLDYAPGWPAITGIDAELRFEGPAMRITANRASIFGVALSGVSVVVPELHAPTEAGEMMTIRGRASGPTADFLRFVSESPVAARIDGFTDRMRAEGSGNLDLTLVMPLRQVSETKVKGDFRFAGNRLALVDGLPPLQDASGTVHFTEHDLVIREARARLFGEPVQISARTPAEGGVRFAAAGGASMRVLHEYYDLPVLEHLSGTASWEASIDVRRQTAQLRVHSDLGGVASSLPEPMNKSATVRWPLVVGVDFTPGGRQEIRVRLEERLALELVGHHGEAGWALERGAAGVFASPPSSARGLRVAAKLEALDVDAWRRVFDDGAEGGAEAVPVSGLALQVARMRAFGQSLDDVRIEAEAAGQGWKGRVVSDVTEGEFEWASPAEGALRARLRYLNIGSADDTGADAQRAEAAQPPRQLPGLDVVAERFSLRGLDLGRLEVQARNRGGQWHLDTLALANSDGRFGGSGLWRPGWQARTELDFRLEADDIGRFLTRLGYSDAVLGGEAALAGHLDWDGAPTRIDYPSLSGTMTLEARNGQFQRLEPGVGRLLGVLSLQSLPRRLTLDFRDVLSEGFAFDNISGSIDVDSGVLRSENLQIRGPAAKILIRGSADVEHETQDLRVTVQPTLSESVAIGAAAGLINPVAGVVTYFAQKALADPIERFFAFDYSITGSWSDPNVEKLSTEGAVVPARPRQDR